jgi:hypothetical protein
MELAEVGGGAVGVGGGIGGATRGHGVDKWGGSGAEMAEENSRSQLLAAELERLVTHYQREQAMAAEYGRTEERVHRLQRELQDVRVQLAGCRR